MAMPSRLYLNGFIVFLSKNWYILRILYGWIYFVTPATNSSCCKLEAVCLYISFHRYPPLQTTNIPLKDLHVPRTHSTLPNLETLSSLLQSPDGLYLFLDVWHAGRSLQIESPYRGTLMRHKIARRQRPWLSITRGRNVISYMLTVRIRGSCIV